MLIVKVELVPFELGRIVVIIQDYNRPHIEPSHELFDPKRILVEYFHADLRRISYQLVFIAVKNNLFQSQRFIPRGIHRVIDRFRDYRLVVHVDDREWVGATGNVQHEHISASVQISVQLERVFLVVKYLTR